LFAGGLPTTAAVFGPPSAPGSVHGPLGTVPTTLPPIPPTDVPVVPPFPPLPPLAETNVLVAAPEPVVKVVAVPAVPLFPFDASVPTDEPEGPPTPIVISHWAGREADKNLT